MSALAITGPDDASVPHLEGGLLVVRLGAPHAVLSWAVHRGGRTRASEVAWRQVTDAELGPEVDPALLLSRSLEARGLSGAVGLLTSRDLSRYEDVTRAHGAYSARCVATVGLGNALAIGDSPGPLRRSVGTINLLCVLSHPVGEGALVEAVSIAAEARTAALVEARFPSRRSLRPATGTGTDCIVVAAPEAGPTPERWVGKHTALGASLGAAVHEAVARGAHAWLAERGLR
ncbi:adenosylcobinamide amidohydrolase [Myxococcus sp. RHSTA-1-4]|uniref:adenosylcobinamide amidohydrolase n=1 Tax=Myxococcus sp. RHSTA-1-4 TaxID=2874601 RepID=UPI001CBAB79E|nr:adenosylcobinamide amidohydrolase [Myxococcus sp. RHSTA-1-4]MBZ4420308.1 adenosylcobinamide amidohydrolase [Myxococcus sp. RHSTA-1-4]